VQISGISLRKFQNHLLPTVQTWHDTSHRTDVACRVSTQRITTLPQLFQRKKKRWKSTNPFSRNAVRCKHADRFTPQSLQNHAFHTWLITFNHFVVTNLKTTNYPL